MNFQGRDCRIISGKYAGLAGSCIEHRQQTGMVLVMIEGVHQGEAIKAKIWFKDSQLEAR